MSSALLFYPVLYHPAIYLLHKYQHTTAQSEHLPTRTNAMIPPTAISIFAIIVSLSTLVYNVPTNTVEHFSQLRFTCLTPDSTVLDYCTMNEFGPGLLLKTRTCKNLCKCAYRGTSTLYVACQSYGCCSNFDVSTACQNEGHCGCYFGFKRDAELLEANATVALKDVEHLGGSVPVELGHCGK
jgi:hypothetical protein